MPSGTRITYRLAAQRFAKQSELDYHPGFRFKTLPGYIGGALDGEPRSVADRCVSVARLTSVKSVLIISTVQQLLSLPVRCL